MVTEVLVRSIVYRLINKIETFARFGGLPGIEELQRFIKLLARMREDQETIFTAAHQNMGFDRLMATFKHVRANLGDIAAKVVRGAEARSLRRVLEAIQSIPNVGGFFAWQILCDLLEARVLGKCCDNQWTILGPGAKNGLGRIFGGRHSLALVRVMRDLCSLSGSSSGFQALGIAFPAFLG